MPQHKTKYNSLWEKEFSWLKPSKNSEKKAKCTICDTEFKIDSAGIGQIKIHASGSKHKQKTSVRANETNQTTFVNNADQVVLSKGSFRLTQEEQVLKAEIIWALKCCASNWSFASCKGIGDLFQAMFPDSAIANSYSMSETKLKYVVQFGLAPVVTKWLIEHMKHRPFTFKFDETTTTQVKKQYDAYVQFFSEKHNRIINHYCGSVFMGHCSAKNLLEHFFKFIKDLDVDVKYLLHIGMDGPNVNKCFEKDLEKDLKTNYQKTILNIGTCSLHQIHTAYAKGLRFLNFNFDEFAQDLHFFFKYSSARREDFRLTETITELKAEYMIKHVSSRWLSLKKVLIRILNQWKNLQEYFLKYLPKEKGFDKEVGSTDRYKRICAKLGCDKTKMYLSFAIYLAEELEEFLLKFQTDKPLVCILYSEIGDLLFKIMSKFLKQEVLVKPRSNGSEELVRKSTEDLGLIACTESSHQKHVIDIEIGISTSHLLSGLENPKLSEVRKIRTEFKLCLVEVVKHLQLRLPHQSSVLRNLQYLNPKQKMSPNAVSSIGKLAYTLADVLKGRIKMAFKLDEETDAGRLSDSIQNQYKMYQLEDIESESYGSLDDYWNKVGHIKDMQNKPKYTQLVCLSKCCLSLSHSNAAAERGFSLNKFLLEERLSLDEETIVALRLVKESVQLYGIEQFPFSKQLFDSVKNSRQQYVAYLEAKKHARTLETNRSLEKKQEKLQKDENNKEKAKILEVLESAKENLHTEELRLSVADNLLAEGHDILKNAINNKNIDKDATIRAQSLISMGMERGAASRKRVAELNESISKYNELLKNLGIKVSVL